MSRTGKKEEVGSISKNICSTQTVQILPGSKLNLIIANAKKEDIICKLTKGSTTFLSKK